MGLIIALIFAGVFAVVALVYSQAAPAPLKRPSRCKPRSTPRLRLRARRRANRLSTCAKTSSSAPFPGSTAGLENSNRSKLQALIHQANLQWSAGSLLAMCGACFAIPAFELCTGRRHPYSSRRFSRLDLWFHAHTFLFFSNEPVLVHLRGTAPGVRSDGQRAARRTEPDRGHGHGLRECNDPLSGEFQTCFEEQNLASNEDRSGQSPHRVPLQDLRIVSTAILIQKESGETSPKCSTRPRTSSASVSVSSAKSLRVRRRDA